MFKLYFEKLSCYDRKSEPCYLAIPFSKGLINSMEELSLTDGKRETVSQGFVTSRWDDGSVKWGMIYFQADLPANKDKTYFCELKKRSDYESINIYREGDLVCIDSGKLLIKLNNTGNIFRSVKTDYISLDENEINGPVLDNSYTAKLTGAWEIVQNGAVMAILQNRGKHFDKEGNSLIDFIVTIQIFKDMDWFKMDYKILNYDENVNIKSLRININPRDVSEEAVFSIGKSNYATDITTGSGGERLKYLIDAEHLVYEANEQMPEVMYGTFFADWCDKNGGICATLYQAFQNFPKAFTASADGILIDIIPESDGVLFCKGMAKTHTVYFHLHRPDEDVNVRSLQFQMPDKPALTPDVYKNSGVFPDIFAGDKISFVERSLIFKFDLKSRAFGMFHWGDSPDFNYTDQGRGSGSLVWSNNEYDFPHAAMLMYARTCERRMLDYLLAGALHWMDVDVCRKDDDPMREGGMIEHSAGHVTGDVEISHEWVEGLFDYYHMTGDRFAYETAIGIGQNIKRQLTMPRYHKTGEINARETGWALRALVALYEETNDASWLSDAPVIVSHFEQWKERYGNWLAPYTNHTAVRVPFMISIAVGSLMRYYRINPQEKIKTMIIDAVDDMVDNCILDNGLFYYKELPSLRRLGNNTIPLEALAYAYELTGDKRYLEAGLPTFVSNIKESYGRYSFGKEKYGDAVISSGDGTKHAAQSFFPVVYFYTAALKAGINMRGVGNFGDL